MSQNSSPNVDRRTLANAIRFLSMDAVQQATCGHPGAPMGMADIAQVLWNDHLQHNPANPLWANRDRFVLSNGHGSLLLFRAGTRGALGCSSERTWTKRRWAGRFGNSG